MTLEGEYYTQSPTLWTLPPRTVAILMTLEGEYYQLTINMKPKQKCRNPHDIGRRILLLSLL